MRLRRLRRPTAKRPPQLRASEISDAYDFTPRHWIRQAAAGRIPGARQPSGVGVNLSGLVAQKPSKPVRR
jgi:hypothetical protein